MIARRLRAAASAAVALALASGAQAEGDAARGRAKAEVCAACHGETGNSTLELTPSLAAQPESYLFFQLFFFRAKLRNVEAMSPLLEGHTDQDLEDLSAYFAGLPLEPHNGPADPARVARGAELSQRLRCASCHLPGYIGQAQMPRLAGQREDYLRHAMQQYQANQRAGVDTSMAAVLYGLAPDELDALAHYMAQQR
jgi:cytochrome c553